MIQKYLDSKIPIQRRIDKMNSRIEATQEINPITGKPVYITSDFRDNGSGLFKGVSESHYDAEIGRFEDPIQAHLRVMEEINPSSYVPKSSLVRTIGDRLTLLDRAQKHRYGGKGHIFSKKYDDRKKKYDNKILNFIKPNLEKYLIDLKIENLPKNKIKEYLIK